MRDGIREIVQQHYQQKLDAEDETLITCLKGMLIDIIKLKSFGGFSKSRLLKKMLEEIRSKYDALTEEINDEEFFNENVNQDLIQLYVDSITSTWGGWQETMILSDLLGINIRLSGQGVPGDNEIEVLYVGGNHYNVYVNNPHNDEVSALIDTIGAQVKQDNHSLKEEQLSIISYLSDYQAHLFLQIIFNNREAYQHISDLSFFTVEEFDTALEYMQMHILNQEEDRTSKLKTFGNNKDTFKIKSKFLTSPLASTSIRDIESDNSSEQSEEEIITSQASPLFQTSVGKKNAYFNFSTEISKITNTLRKTGLEDEGYYTNFDDSSGDEADKEADAYSITDKLEELGETVVNNSFLSHALATQLLYSPQVRKHYKPLKKKLLRNDIDIIKEAKWPVYNSIYSSLIKIIPTDQTTAQLIVKAFLDTKADFINEIEEILKYNVRTFRHSIHDKKKVQTLLQTKCNKLFDSLFQDLKEYTENYVSKAKVADINTENYIYKIIAKDLNDKLKKFFDVKFSSLTKADKDILKKEEIGVLTSSREDICTSATKRKQIKQLKLDDKEPSKLSLVAKAVLKTIQEEAPSSKNYSDFKRDHKGTLLKNYIELLIKEAKKENIALNPDDVFIPENYELSIFVREEISKEIFKITPAHSRPSTKNIKLKDFTNIAIINDIIDNMYDNLVFITSHRKTLQSTHIFDLEELQTDESIFSNYLATLRISYRSIRREIRNKEDSQKSEDYLVDSVLFRHWNFPHTGAEYTEQQTINEGLTRTDYAMFGTQSSSYPSLVGHIEKIKHQLSKFYEVKDSSIVKHIRSIFNQEKLNYDNIYGGAKENHKRIIGEFEETQINKMITRIAGLILGTEAQRNPAALIHSQMILDLIESEDITFSDAFYSYTKDKVERKIIKHDKDYFAITEGANLYKYYFLKNGGDVYNWNDRTKTSMTITIVEKIFILKDRITQEILMRTSTIVAKITEYSLRPDPLMPMAPLKSTSMAVSLNKHYKSNMPYPYIHNGAESEFSDLVVAENRLVELWKEKIAINKEYLVASIYRACLNNWFSIDITSKQYMKRMLLEIFSQEILDEQLDDLSINQLRELEEISFDIEVNDLIRLHEYGNLMSLLEIIEMYKESEKRFTDLSAEKVIDFYKQLQEWDEDISFDDICKIYDTSKDKLWDLINNEEDDHLIEEHGLQEVSDTYDAIYAECGGNEPDYTGYREDGEEYNIYNRVHNRLSEAENESNSDESYYGLNEDRSSLDGYDEASSENGGSSNEDLSVYYCFTNIIYDHPELINSLSHNKVGRDRFLESTLFKKDVSYTTTDTYLDTCHGIDLNYIVNNLGNRVVIKSKTHILSPYLEWMLNGVQLSYLNPLSDEYKKLIQEWSGLENIYTSTTAIGMEEYINDYSSTAALLIGILLSYPSIE